MVILTAKLVLFGGAAWTARFVMDELGYLEQVGTWEWESLYRTFDPIKPVLAGAAFLPAHALAGSAEVARAARGVGWTIALLSLTLIGLGAHRLAAGRWHALLAVFTALSFSNFCERAFRIRTDTVALPFALGALVVLLAPRRGRWATCAAGALLGGAFLCTQKAIYFAVAFGVALVIATWSTSGWRLAWRDGAQLLGGWCSAFFVYAVWFGGVEWMRVVRMVLVGPRYVLEGTAAFSGLGQFVTQTLVRNLIPYSLCGAGLALSLMGWRRAGFAVRFAAVATLLVTLFIFAHDQPWPYVFVWAQVFLALWVIPLVFAVIERGWLTATHAFLAVVFLGMFSLPRQVRYFGHTNAEQLAVMAEAERLLAPEDRYFDGVGIVVTRRIAGPYPMWWWDGPNLARLRGALRAGDDSVPQAILADHPKLWIWNYRLQAMDRLVTGMTASSTVRVSPLVLLSGIELAEGSTEASFLCHWPGRYRLFDANGRVVDEPVSIDGGAATVVADLSAGMHRVTRPAGRGRRVLLPLGTALSRPLPTTEPAPDLYAEVYSY